MRLLDVVLVDDLADQLLDEVLERDQAGGAAVLVDDDRHVELLGLHLAQQLGDPLGLGHERAPGGASSRTGVVAPAVALGAHEVLGVDDADDVVDALADDRDAAVAVEDARPPSRRRPGSRRSTVTMSGRGTITSRTTVSPNSMIELDQLALLASITSSSTATSAMASSSSSDTNGPCFRPLPGG